MMKRICIWLLFTMFLALTEGFELRAMPLPIEPHNSAASKTPSRPKVWLALKNNLLYDLALAPNIEVEIPILKKWSLNAECKIPWWSNTSKGLCCQLLSGGIEWRYRFGGARRSAKGENPLSGHFIGVYAEGGKYDFQFQKEKGYRGLHYAAAGISYGYTKPIARRLALELSIGIGFLDTKYRKYTSYNDRLVWTSSGRYQNLLPTKAKVSLVWFLTKKK